MKRYASSDEMLNAVDYIVEANSFEQTTLWKKYHEKVKWEEHLSGFGVHVGDIADLHPVWISILVETINGKVVLFWYPTSNVVDYEMCERFIMRKTVNRDSKSRLVDANHFPHILQDIEKGD